MVDILLGLKSRIPKEQPCISNHDEYHHLKDILTSAAPGDIIIVHGPAGCGKNVHGGECNKWMFKKQYKNRCGAI